MIDEKELIAQIEDLLNLLELEQDLRMIHERPKVGEWIPITERLPEEPLQSVIGWDADYKRPCFAQYIDGEWRVTNPSNWFPNITAWMPLPEPYRENK